VREHIKTQTFAVVTKPKRPFVLFKTHKLSIQIPLQLETFKDQRIIIAVVDCCLVATYAVMLSHFSFVQRENVSGSEKM